MNAPEKLNYGFRSRNIINESEKSVQDVKNILNTIKSDISQKESHINQLPSDVMTQAASGIIWLQTTYSLNILKMTEGKIVSTGGNTPTINSHQSVHKIVFEDLIRISEDAMRMGLYATGIQFPFPVQLRSNKTHLKHIFALLNNSGADFDSAVYFPYRIRDGKFN